MDNGVKSIVARVFVVIGQAVSARKEDNANVIGVVGYGTAWVFSRMDDPPSFVVLREKFFCNEVPGHSIPL